MAPRPGAQVSASGTAWNEAGAVLRTYQLLMAATVANLTLVAGKVGKMGGIYAGPPFPRPGSLAWEGGPIFPLRKGRQVVFGPPPTLLRCRLVSQDATDAIA